MALVVFSFISTIFFWGCFALTRERIKPIMDTTHSLKEDIADLLKNRPWWILLCAGVAALIFNSIRDGAAVYYFKYYVAEDAGIASRFPFMPASLSLATLYLLLGQASNIIGVIMATPVANKIGKKATFIGAMFLAAVLSLVFYTAGKNDVYLMLVLQVLISICAGSIFPLLWSMYADIADYSEWHSGRRATGLIFSSSSMSQKFGWTIGGATTGWLLGYFGFEANVVQTEGALSGIRFMLSILPAIGAALSCIAIFFYPLSEKRLAGIVTELNEKRKNVN
jgi:GPH family glycoside/pentoside/hexuronide:cation symporter